MRNDRRLDGRHEFPTVAIRLFLILCCLIGAAGSAASQGLRIAATVNDEMISIFDVEARMSVAMFLSKVPDTIEARRRLAPQILRAIIDDKLKMQEVRRQEIAVEQDEILSGIEQWEQRIGLPPGQLTALSQQIGIDKSTIVEQVETSVTWNKLLREKFLPTITYEEREIDDILAEELSRRGQPEFRVSEIYLPYSRDRSRTDVQTQAERLVAEIRQGAPFDAVARNFSQSPTAGVGGDLGWLRLGHLPTELENVIKTMAPDTVSAPIATFDGVYLLQLVEKRAIEPLAERSGEPATVTVHQIHFELPPNPSDADRAAARQRAQEISAQARNCTDMDTLGQKYGTSLSGSPGKLLVDQLSALVRDAIVGLPVHQTSRPVDIEGGLIVVMVCDRLEPKTKAISQEDLRRQIVNRLINERVNLAARQFLRSLRQAAIIDIRI